MSCFENTASQGNLNDRGLVRPDRSEDEPSGAKPDHGHPEKPLKGLHSIHQGLQDLTAFCFVLFCFVLLPLCRIAGSWFPNQGSNAGHSNESTESCLDHHGIPKVFLIEERHGLMWRRSGELILLFILNFVYAIHSHVFKNQKV